MAVEIRPRRPEDVPDLGAVLVRVHAQDGYPVEGVDDPEGWITPPREVAAWTALYVGRPIGHVSLTRAAPEDDAASLWARETGGDLSRLVIPVRLFVDPPHRQRGAGQSLMRAAYGYATAHDVAITFDVMLKDRAAIRLYEALGCQRLGTIEHRHTDGQSEPAAVYAVPAGGLDAVGP